ncbi:MAG: hypothetical protein EXQ95_14885 [Alphaproteobacteria bacterium]|nr:hypothetical protein [Alphaproteobacteria bacterium]
MGRAVAEMLIALAAERGLTAKNIAKAPSHLQGMLESLQRKGRATAAAVWIACRPWSGTVVRW